MRAAWSGWDRAGGLGGGAVAELFLVLLELFGDEDARSPGDDDRQLVAFQALRQQAVKLVRAVPGFDHMHPADAERAGEVFEDELAGRLVVEFAARARVLLVPGHGGGGVVEEDYHRAPRGGGVENS